MKNVSAKATLSRSAEGLFLSRDSARDMFRAVIEIRHSGKASDVAVGGVRIHTHKAIPSGKRK